MDKPRIAILGDGGWGTTLASLVSAKGYSVTLWGAFEGYSKLMAKTRLNPKFLPGIKIPHEVQITSDIKAAVTNKDILVLAVPAQYTRGVLKKVKGKFNKKYFWLYRERSVKSKKLDSN